MEIQLHSDRFVRDGEFHSVMSGAGSDLEQTPHFAQDFGATLQQSQSCTAASFSENVHDYTARL